VRSDAERIALITLLLLFLQLEAAAETNFYGHLLGVSKNYPIPHWVSSSELTDTNNTAVKIPNLIINLQSLGEKGEIAGIRLGMTMDQVVARWGKPPKLYSHCGGGPRFFFSDTSLVFRDNVLSIIWIPEQAITLDRAACVDVLGKPTSRKHNGTFLELLYEHDGQRLFLRFQEGKEDFLNGYIELRSEPGKMG
jgi:hypothetical protein